MALVAALVFVLAPARGQAPVSFQGLWSSVETESYTVVQLRRFFDYSSIGGPVVTTVREQLSVLSNNTKDPDFEVSYVGVEGEPPGSSLWTKWAQNYAKNGGVFVEHGTFRVRDLQRVPANYTLHDFGSAVRAGRAVRRVVVFPGQLDKAIWLLEVDLVTNVPLYTAEFDSRLRLLSEVATLSFVSGAQLGATSSQGGQVVTSFASYQSASAFMGNPDGLVDAGFAVGEYGVDSVKVKVNPLNNRKTLVLEYTDGVDEFLVLQTPGVPDLFDALPLTKATPRSNTIARYRDQSMSVLLFWDDGVSFQVTGRGALMRLDDFAKGIYRKAILFD